VTEMEENRSSSRNVVFSLSFRELQDGQSPENE
jgi:hypothetical protein